MTFYRTALKMLILLEILQDPTDGYKAGIEFHNLLKNCHFFIIMFLFYATTKLNVTILTCTAKKPVATLGSDNLFKLRIRICVEHKVPNMTW